MEPDIEAFRDMLNFDGKVAFLGERGNLLAYKGHLNNPDRYVWLEDASPESLQPLLSSQDSVLLFVLDGPPWVRVLAKELANNVSSLVLCFEMGPFTMVGK